MEELDFFRIEHNDTPPKKGMVLISEPFSDDAFFSRSVILLTDHGEDGSVGFILNRPVDLPLNETIEGFPDIPAKVALGGPVNTDKIFFIHSLNPELIPGSVHVIDNIYWGGNFNKLIELLSVGAADIDRVRFFVGYSGWAKGQLMQEIKNNFWLVCKISAETIMINGKEVWQRAVKNLDNKYKVWAHMPEDPIFN